MGVAHLRKAEGGRLSQSGGEAGYARDPTLSMSFVMRTALRAGIVFLMTVKPGLEESLAAVGAATAAGVLASLAVTRRDYREGEDRQATGRWKGLVPGGVQMKASHEYRPCGAHSMSATTSILSQNLLSRAAWYAIAVLVLTTVHHIYGAYVYQTPWRLHVALISGVTAAAIIGSLHVLRHTEDATRHVAFWAFVGVTLVIPVGGIGLFEGGYNHVLKDTLYFAGASTSLMTRMFPPPAYELPDNAFFEITGLMQVVPASVTGWLLYRLVRSRSGASTLSTDGSVRRARKEAHAKLDGSDTIIRRTLAGVSGEPISIPDSHRLVHLQFRRFAGCPVCNLHLHSFGRRHGEIAAAGIREVIVFHAKVDDLRPYTGDLPFAVIADPDKRLYLEFGVESSPRALLDPRAWPAILRGIIQSFVAIVRDKQPLPSLTPHGGRCGLPADFLIASNGRVLARKYGNHADDQWSVEEVVTLAREAASQRYTAPSSIQPAAELR
jgi:hypothetical protein